MSKAVKVVTGIVLTVVGVVTMNPQLIAAGVSISLSGLAKTPKAATSPTNAASTQRLNKTLVPEEYRKIIFGKTACGLDMRYWEVWGSGYNNYDEVLATSTHKITSYQELYLEGELVTFSGNSATGTYAGALTRRTSLIGVAGTSLQAGAGSLWSANASLTGCSHMVLAWVYSQSKLPNGIPSRITQVVEGAPVYDPRRDSTRGGSGAHRAEDQTTWEYAPLDANGQPIGRNNALQALWYLIGWRFNDRLVAGRGVDLNDINFASFITAANNCVAAQYYSDMILSTGDTHSTNEAIITAAAGGQLEDPGGLWSYHVAVDDTASIAVTLTDDDILEEVSWVPQLPISEQFNEIAGTFVDASSTGLYQPRAYPTVTDAAYITADGYRRRKTINYQAVQSAAQAQKLARIELNRARFQGVFKATFNMRAFRAQSYDCVLLTFSRYGWVNKLFRVSQVGINPLGGVDLIMREEHGSVYSGGTVATVPPPSAGQAFDPRTKFAVTSLLGVTRSSAGGVSGTAYDGVLLTWAQASQNVRRIEVQFKKSTETYWTPAGSLLNDKTELLISPLLPGTAYNFQVRFISLYDMIGDWYQYNVTTSTTTSTPAGAVTYSDGTPVQALKPQEAGANVTETRTAAGITGQTVWATYAAMTPGQVVQPGSNLVFDGGLKLRAQNWGFGVGWGWANSEVIGPYVASSANSSIITSPRLSVVASVTYTAQVWGYMNGVPTTPSLFYIAWYNASDGLIGNTTPASISSTTPQKHLTSGAAPAGAVYARIAFGTQNTGGSALIGSKFKLESGATASVFSDEATAGALYQNGINIDALKPGELGANVTETRTAAGISGQTIWATYAAMTPGQVVQPGSNLVFDGGLKLRAQNWNMSSPWFWGYDAGLGGYIAVTSAGFAQAARFNVNVGATYTAQSWAAMTGAYSTAGSVYLAWYNASDVYIGETTRSFLSNVYSKVTNSGVAPAGAVYGRVAFHSGVMSTGAAVFSKVKCEQGSSASVFSDDATAGALYANGVNIDTLKPGELGANVTESRTAAAITGQGALATMNVVGPGNMSGFSNLAQIVANMGPITAGSININNRFAVDSSGNVTIVSATSGARMTLSNSVLEVYDASNVRRVRLGIW